MCISKGAEFILKVTEEIIKCDKNDETISDVKVKSRGMGGKSDGSLRPMAEWYS